MLHHRKRSRSRMTKRSEAEMNEPEPLSHYIFHREIRMHDFFLFEVFGSFCFFPRQTFV
jgi:hypothetical protein